MDEHRDPPIGRLVLVATPIGNLDDLSPRAVAELAAADVIACEDTRRTGRLLAHAGVDGSLLALHEHNESQRASSLVDRMLGGEVVVVVSDAGTPGISDPGYQLVVAAIAAGVQITAVPGPAALIHALVISGLPTDRFAFEGFLPRRPGPRGQRLAALAGDDRTLIFYVAPHRAHDDLSAMAEAFGADRPAALARELTKRFEEVRRGTLAELMAGVADKPPKGEITVVVAGSPPATPSTIADDDVLARVEDLVRAGQSRRDAVRQVADETGLPKRQVYDVANRR